MDEYLASRPIRASRPSITAYHRAAWHAHSWVCLRVCPTASQRVRTVLGISTMSPGEAWPPCPCATNVEFARRQRNVLLPYLNDALSTPARTSPASFSPIRAKRLWGPCSCRAGCSCLRNTKSRVATFVCIGPLCILTRARIHTSASYSSHVRGRPCARSPRIDDLAGDIRHPSCTNVAPTHGRVVVLLQEWKPAIYAPGALCTVSLGPVGPYRVLITSVHRGDPYEPRENDRTGVAPCSLVLPSRTLVCGVLQTTCIVSWC